MGFIFFTAFGKDILQEIVRMCETEPEAHMEYSIIWL
jgi:hypothetical protein